MLIIHLTPGDEVDLKKQHPCGSHRFRILRVGSDIRSVCLGCGRDLTMDRLRFEKSIKKLYPVNPSEENTHDENKSQ